MWVKVIENTVILSSGEPEQTENSIIFFQEEIPQGDGYLFYDGEKLVLQNYEKVEQPFTIEKLVQTELHSI